MQQFIFETASSVVCELGSSQKVAEQLKILSVKKVQIVTDPGIVAAGLDIPIIKALKKSNISTIIFSEVKADPSEEVLLAAIDMAKSADIEGVIGLGGGSSMDIAKLVAALTHSKQALADIYGIGNIRGSRLPLIQIPTTAGTGSEVTPIAIITTGETTKAGIISRQLLPDFALLDAELTIGLPAQITAATGVDAMVHAIEAFTSKHKKNVYSDMLAHKALSLMSANIREAVHNGNNIEARSNMLLGSMLAGQAFANAPVAAVHALAYPLGGFFHIPHGLSNSLVLPHVLLFNLSEATSLYAQLLPDILGKSTEGNEESKAERFLHEINKIISDINLPTQLSQLNINESDLPMLAESAMLQQRLLVNNPRTVTYNDALAIYQAAF